MSVKMAELLFPEVKERPEDIEKRFPKRELAPGARVTRLGPSPTGFIHLGNLYGAFVDERLAHQSEGVFYLRIEDTDDKRYVEGAVETIIDSLDFFGIRFDEGATKEGEVGAYGPYHQSQRAEIYRIQVQLVAHFNYRAISHSVNSAFQCCHQSAVRNLHLKRKLPYASVLA